MFRHFIKAPTGMATSGAINMTRWLYHPCHRAGRFTTSYTYDSQLRKVRAVTNANGAVTRYQYDSGGNRTNTTDALGNVTTYT